MHTIFLDLNGPRIMQLCDLETVLVDPAVQTQRKRGLEQQLVVVELALEDRVRGPDGGVPGEREAAEACDGGCVRTGMQLRRGGRQDGATCQKQ